LVSCPHCGGRRFGEEALGVRVEGINVAELLELSITKLLDHPFADIAGWQPLLKQLVALDLGYLTLGRRVDRLSGGEHQRLRIAGKLEGEQPEGLLLVLDEPSAGLHPKDVARLLSVLDNVVAEGRNTVVLVEHNLDLIRASDWVIDFGPGGGPEGGKIVGQGPPDKIAKNDTPTGRVLSNKRNKSTPRLAKKTRVKDATSDSVDSKDAAHSGRQWLKRLLGEESSAEELDPVGFEGLAVMYDAASEIARPYEIGGLDVEIARLLLDEPDDASKQPERLAKLWLENPDAQLRIHPLIEELRVWGDKIPSSALKAAQQRLKHAGLESDLTVSSQSKLASVRATGKRFQPSKKTFNEYARCVRDALGIGGGYVELWDARSGVIDFVQRRHINFESSAIAPLSPGSACLVRSHTIGGCPCCAGNVGVQAFDESLVIARKTDDPTSESFFHPEAIKVLRGVRRNILLPFLKRMATEGLWPEGQTFTRLHPEERTILMHGYWHRPGPGSFLKTSSSDPEKVESWLRWSGLFRTVLDEVDRSNSDEWVKQVRATTHSIECPVCDGTGLQAHARAISLGSRTFFDWIRDGTIGGLVKALSKLVPQSARSKERRAHILDCLEPLNQSVPNTPLRKPIEDTKLLRAVFNRVVRGQTRLKVLG
jgi:excinuclease UvrABC ATPase subunit